MHTLWFILACFSGAFAFAFLLAGILGLQDITPPNDRAETVFQFIDVTVFGGIASVARGFDKNWSTRTKERRLFCTGLGWLGAFILFQYLASSTT
jgi:membrane protease YdiL (CAAX protease family)